MESTQPTSRRRRNPSWKRAAVSAIAVFCVCVVVHGVWSRLLTIAGGFRLGHHWAVAVNEYSIRVCWTTWEGLPEGTHWDTVDFGPTLSLTPVFYLVVPLWLPLLVCVMVPIIGELLRHWRRRAS